MSAELEALAAKYREMIALRKSAEKDEARLKALAARFPGALRELDTRTMTSLEARLAEIEAALAGAPAPAWASTVSAFHGWLRVALRLRAEGVTHESARAWLPTYVPKAPGDPASIDERALALLLAPPDGRLSRAARALLGAPSEVDLDALLFGPQIRD